VSEFVADASAVLAFARGEPGEKRVAKVRGDCLVVSLNLLEAFSKLVRYEMPADQVQGFLREAFPRVEAVDRRLAETAAVLHATTRTLGLSYADCVCLAFGASRQAIVLTADRRWKDVKLDVNVELIR
jgi:PIN domain nuclease of toxin-antitoxin system